jgi:hypothetical protein
MLINCKSLTFITEHLIFSTIYICLISENLILLLLCVRFWANLGTYQSRATICFWANLGTYQSRAVLKENLNIDLPVLILHLVLIVKECSCTVNQMNTSRNFDVNRYSFACHSTIITCTGGRDMHVLG